MLQQDIIILLELSCNTIARKTKKKLLNLSTKSYNYGVTIQMKPGLSCSKVG